MNEAAAKPPGRNAESAPPAGGITGLGFALLLLIIVLSLSVPQFLTLRNLNGLALSVALVGTIAPSMMLVLALGEVDLSVASIVAFAGVVASIVTSSTHSVVFGIVAGVLAGGTVGLVNGLLVARAGINSLIATLATMEIVRGLSYIVAHGDAVIITQEKFFLLGAQPVLGVTLPVWLMVAVFAIFGVILNFTILGKNVLAIGGNREAARLAGVPVLSIRTLIFTLQGLVTGLAGVMLASRLSLGDPKTSLGLELAVISACVLGGVSLAGGVASIGGVILGVLIMGCVQNALGLLNVPTFYQYLVRGGILLIAVAFDRWKNARRG